MEKESNGNVTPHNAIVFTCPNCDNVIEIEEETSVGDKYECPICGNVYIITK